MRGDVFSHNILLYLLLIRNNIMNKLYLSHIYTHITTECLSYEVDGREAGISNILSSTQTTRDA